LIELTGAVNAYTISELQTKLLTYIEDSAVVVDLSDVTAIDSTGMGVFMAVYNEGEIFGNKLYFMNPSESAKKVIDATGFSDTFFFIHSVTEID
nr:STAS domain-containing protein [Treponema sp.]